MIEAYSNIVPLVKPEYRPSKSLLNPYWIAGFVQADGTFGLKYVKANRKLGYSCQALFRVTQHERDLIVLERIINTLGCGNVNGPYSGRDRYDISFSSIKYVSNIIIPFFKNYPLYGAKSLDFQSFCQGVSIIEKGGHLTQEGLDKLKLLAYSMNTYRKF